MTTVEDALRDLLANLVAAVSLLERGSKKAAPSDKMFDQMIVDYKRSIARGRVFLGMGSQDDPADRGDLDDHSYTS
ncbi:MAG TPA: hypothetical protein VH024_17315 [Candidatus Angelobacter sp.]|jgi:hypothetical protein|nr:hypothetical protein [Candidatus Angelobacter sp.]